MFYETAQTIGPGWHRSYKPSHYEDMTWSPTSRQVRSPGSSPQSYRRIIHPDDYDDDKIKDEDDFFSGRKSKIFKEVFDDPQSPNHRFGDRPRLFKRVFKPNRWDDDFDRGTTTATKLEREFDADFNEFPNARKIEREFDRHRDRDLKADIEDEFEKAAGRVHHIPIMVERRLDEMKSKFGRASPPPEATDFTEDSEEWLGPQVHRLRKNFEPQGDEYSTLHSRHRVPRVDIHSRPRAFTSPIPPTWDPHSVHTLPIRRVNKGSQGFDEKRSTTPKSVFRSYSETHDDIPRHQQHSAAFRSHSDGHCPKNTYVTRISVNVPSDRDNTHGMTNGDIAEEQARNREEENYGQQYDDGWDSHQNQQRPFYETQQEPQKDSTHQSPDNTNNVNFQPKQSDSDGETTSAKPQREDNRASNASLQQIASVLQNVEDLFLRVEAYSGTGRDKQFRFLDEMLTRCMLRLDDVDTEGREDIRNARKAAVRQVIACIEKLESKANESEQKKTLETSTKVPDEPQNQKPENDEKTEDKGQEIKNDPSETETIDQPQTTEDSEQTRL